MLPVSPRMYSATLKTDAMANSHPDAADHPNPIPNLEENSPFTSKISASARDFSVPTTIRNTHPHTKTSRIAERVGQDLRVSMNPHIGDGEIVAGVPVLSTQIRAGLFRQRLLDRSWPVARVRRHTRKRPHEVHHFACVRPQSSRQISVCSEISSASSTSIARYLTVPTSLSTSEHRLETTARYTHVATEVLRAVISSLDTVRPT